MFDIGFGEIVVVLIIGLIVLGPERLPVAVKTVAGWIRAMRSLASSVQNELTQELKLQELQESLKKAEQAGLQNLSPELKASMDELRAVATGMKRDIESDLNPTSAPAEASSATITSPSSVSETAEKATMDAAANKNNVPPVNAVIESVTPDTHGEAMTKPSEPETRPLSSHHSDSEK